MIDESLGPAASILHLDNNEYVLLSSGQEVDIFHNLQLTKIDDDLNKIWTKSYPRPLQNFSKQVLKTEDGFILLGSGTESDLGSSDLDIFIIKTDEQGEEIWSKYYGGEATDRGEAIIKLEDGGFIILGFSFANNLARNRLIIKIDANGEELWSKENESNFNNEGWSIAAAGNNEYVLMGTNISADSTKTEIEIERIDVEGNSIWIKEYESVDPFSFDARIIKSNEGGFMLIATQASGLNNNDSDMFILKIDEFGDKEWSKAYGGDKGEDGKAVLQTSDNNYVLLGFTGSFGNGSLDILVVKVDQLGEQLWARSFGGPSFEYGLDLIENDNGEILICGGIEGNSSNTDYDLLLLKLDSNGNPI